MPDPSIFTSIIDSYLPEPDASLLNGIIFGVDIKSSGVFLEQLKRVGLLHLVVLSGMNITIFGAIISSLFDRFGKKISSLITILTIVFFIIFVGPKAPIVRAGIMGILTLVAVIYGRLTIAVYTLIISAFIMLIFKPYWLTTVSFQLSFGATLGIILFGRQYYSKPKTLADKIKYFVKNELKASLSAQIFTVPIIFLYFREISVIAPISNLLVAPLVGPVMVFGLLTAILGRIHYWFGLVPAVIVYAMLHYIVLLVDFISSLPFVFFSF